MSSFYDYGFNANNKSTGVAMDEKDEKMVLIRRLFKIDPKVQKELGHESKEEGDEGKDKAKPSTEDELTIKKDLLGRPCLATKDDMTDFGSPSRNNAAVQKHCSDSDDNAEGREYAEDSLEAALVSKLSKSSVAMDLSPRHSKTPIEECRAKDKRYCPYHGADFMTSLLDAQFKEAGIYASGGVERIKGGRYGNGSTYKVQYSVPESKKEAANKIIDEFLKSDGFKEFDETESDDVDAIAKTVKMDHGDDNFGMREEHLDTLEKDMKKGMSIEPSAFYQLRTDLENLKKLSDKAHEAIKEAGFEPNGQSKDAKEWKKGNADWQAYLSATDKFNKDYNEIRGNADLAHIKTPEDCTELMEHLEKQINQIGDFVKATDEIASMKDKKGLKGKKGIPGTSDYNAAKNSIDDIIKDLKDSRKMVEEAKDLKEMRAAAHRLEVVLRNVEERKGAIANAVKEAESYKKVLEGYPNLDEGIKEKGKTEEAKPKAEEKTEVAKAGVRSLTKKEFDALTDALKEWLPGEKITVSKDLATDHCSIISSASLNMDDMLWEEIKSDIDKDLETILKGIGLTGDIVKVDIDDKTRQIRYNVNNIKKAVKEEPHKGDDAAKAYTDKLNAKKGKESTTSGKKEAKPKASPKYSEKQMEEYVDILSKLIPQGESLEIPISLEFYKEGFKSLEEVAKKKGYKVVKTDGGKMKVSKI